LQRICLSGLIRRDEVRRRNIPISLIDPESALFFSMSEIACLLQLMERGLLAVMFACCND
jgi:hypothetical protein